MTQRELTIEDVWALVDRRDEALNAALNWMTLIARGEVGIYGTPQEFAAAFIEQAYPNTKWADEIASR